MRPGTFEGQDGYRHVDDKRSRIRLLIYKIRLKLNPEELDNNNLLKKIDDLKNSKSDFYYIMEQAVLVSQNILKRERTWIKKES